VRLVAQENVAVVRIDGSGEAASYMSPLSKPYLAFSSAKVEKLSDSPAMVEPQDD
jgi:hypothetical protein